MANLNFQTNSTIQRHARTPYAKQNASISLTFSGERRNSWHPTSSASAVNAGLNISAQQRAQLERIYVQSIGQNSHSTSPSSNNPNLTGQAGDNLFGVQQLLKEFQKLCASTKEGSPVSNSLTSYGLVFYCL